MPTRDAADQWYEGQIKSRLATTDANDMLYQFNASRDYDPSPKLEKITAAVLAINSADDVVNPPELGLMEKLIPRVKRGRYILIPTSDQTRGHGTHSLPADLGTAPERLLEVKSDRSMSDDRKYRQRGYQDEPSRAGSARAEAAAAAAGARAWPRAPGRARTEDAESHGRARSVSLRPVRQPAVDAGRPLDRCSKCGVDLHACIQCVSFDTSARWECTENAKLPARVAPKDERNTCAFFTPRTTVERQTSTPASVADRPRRPTARSVRSMICSSDGTGTRGLGTGGLGVRTAGLQLTADR